MLGFYYTGATAYKDAQTLAEKSTGGYMSKSTIQNGFANNLFPDLCSNQILNNSEITHHVGLIAMFSDAERNALGEEEDKKKDITFELTSFETENPDNVEISIAATQVSGDTSSGLYIEKLQNSLVKPFNIIDDFIKFELNSPITFSGVSVKNGLGFWFRRKVKTEGMIDLAPDSKFWQCHERLEDIKFLYNIKITVTDSKENSEEPGEGNEGSFG